MSKTPENLVAEGDKAMAARNWPEAVKKYHDAREAIVSLLGDPESLESADSKPLEYMPEFEDVQPDEVGRLKAMLATLDGSENTPGVFGKIAMAKDPGTRVVRLKHWIESRIPQGSDASERRRIFAEARYELVMNSLNGALQSASQKAIDRIEEREGVDGEGRFKISEIVFAYVARILDARDQALDQVDEFGALLTYSTDLDGDPQFNDRSKESEDRASRSQNGPLTNERIVRRFEGLRSKDYSQNIYSKYPEIFDQLSEDVEYAISPEANNVATSPLAGEVLGHGVISLDIGSEFAEVFNAIRPSVDSDKE